MTATATAIADAKQDEPVVGRASAAPLPRYNDYEWVVDLASHRIIRRPRLSSRDAHRD